MLLVVASVIIPLVMFGSFAWPILKQFYQSCQKGGVHANLPLFIFGGFFLMFIFGPIFSVLRLFRRLDKEGGSPVSVPPPARDQPGSIFLFLFSLPFAGFEAPTHESLLPHYYVCPYIPPTPLMQDLHASPHQPL